MKKKGRSKSSRSKPKARRTQRHKKTEFLELVGVNPGRAFKVIVKELRLAWRTLTVKSLPLKVGAGVTTLLLVYVVLSLSHRPTRANLPAHSIETLSSDVPALEKESWDFFHPVWKNTRGWQLLPSTPDIKVGIDSTRAKMLRLTYDPENKISEDFKVQRFIRHRVVFWMLVHSQYSDRVQIVHDRDNPGIIYGYIDYRPLYRVLGITKRLEIKKERVEKEIVQELRSRIIESASDEKPSLQSEDEKHSLRQFLSQVGALSESKAKELALSLRTQTGQRNEFYRALGRSKHLLPHIESVMKIAQMPTELARLPFVESSFNYTAESKVGAMGIWQFMPPTARELIHPTEKDKWTDPIWQTRGAAKLFTRYRSVLPDWGSTITAYNSGVGRVGRMLKRHKLSGIEGLLSLPENDGLGFAGKNFLAQFLSALTIENYREDIFDPHLTQKEVADLLKGSSLQQENCDF